VDETESDDGNDVDSDDGSNRVAFHRFLKEHPLHHSHHVRLLEDVHEWVPNLLVGLCQEVIVETENITALLC